LKAETIIAQGKLQSSVFIIASEQTLSRICGDLQFGLVWFPIANPIPDPMKVRVGCCPLGFLFKVLANESFLSIDAAGHYV